MKTLCALAAGALTLVLPAAAGSAPASFSDPSGDNGAAADIGAVTADLTADGFITLKASTANLPPVGQPGFVVAAFDTDRNGATGSLMGGDYVLLFDIQSGGRILQHWNGTEYADTPGDTIVTLGNGSVELKVKPAGLGGATAFNFVVAVATGSGDAAAIDFAPDGGTWFYELKAPVVTVDRVNARFVPAAPRAGAVFQAPIVRIRLSDGRTILAPKYRCVAQLGGKLLRGSGKGSCTFRIPQNAKGKRLSVAFFVTYNGVTDAFDPYVFKVR